MMTSFKHLLKDQLKRQQNLEIKLPKLTHFAVYTTDSLSPRPIEFIPGFQIRKLTASRKIS